MKISFAPKHYKKHHLQKPTFLQNFFPTKIILLFIGVFFILGMLGTSLISRFALADTALEESLPSNEERCYWQEDVARFFALQEGKQNALQTSVPCEIPSVPSSVENIEVMKHLPDNDLSVTIRAITTGYPIEVMIPTIATFDREIAALIVGIAKKESNWGKRVPVDKSGNDCFNYWGYKGVGTRGIEMGHSCFGSPEEAATVVGNRLKHLVELRKTSDPKNMIIWKCGSSCAGHSDESVRKWIADVSLYYNRIALLPE